MCSGNLLDSKLNLTSVAIKIVKVVFIWILKSMYSKLHCFNLYTILNLGRVINVLSAINSMSMFVGKFLKCQCYPLIISLKALKCP